MKIYSFLALFSLMLSSCISARSADGRIELPANKANEHKILRVDGYIFPSGIMHLSQKSINTLGQYYTKNQIKPNLEDYNRTVLIKDVIFMEGFRSSKYISFRKSYLPEKRAFLSFGAPGPANSNKVVVHMDDETCPVYIVCDAVYEQSAHADSLICTKIHQILPATSEYIDQLNRVYKNTTINAHAHPLFDQPLSSNERGRKYDRDK